MKTSIYLLILIRVLTLDLSAQINAYDLEYPIATKKEFKKNIQELQPVYYNFSQRKLYYKPGMRLNGNEFLNLCRSINDPAIQDQVARYDQLTRKKKGLIGGMIACAVGGYVTMMASMVAVSGSGYYNPNGYATMALGAAVLFIGTPVFAISTAFPHQKRKEILFRDLPEAYNFYATSNK